MLARIDKDVVLTIAARLIIACAGVITSIITARQLGLDGRGIYFYAVTLAGFVTQFANLGLPSANIYLVARDQSKLAVLVANSIWVSLVTLVLSCLLLTALAPMLHQDMNIALLGGVLGSVNLLLLLLSNLLVGIQKTRQFNLVQLLANGLTLLFAVLTGWFHGSPQHFLMAGIGAVTIATLVNLRALHPGWRRYMFDLSLLRRAAAYSMRAFTITIIGFAMLRGNVLLLKHYSDLSHLGYYSIATQITDALNILPASFALVIFPRLVQGKAGNRYETMLLQAKTVALITVAACLCAALLAPPFIRLAFGASFLPATELLYLMLPGTFFLAVSSIISQYLAAEGIPRVTIYVWLVAFSLMLTLCVALIPAYDAAGAAIAFSGSHALLFVCMLTAAHHHERKRLQASAT